MAKALKQVHLEDVLVHVLIQLLVIILTARLFAALFKKLGQPGVVGEIAAGLILGPSLLGKFFPDAFNAVFHPQLHAVNVPPELMDATLHWIMTVMSQLGLVLLLFLIGLEFDFRHLVENRRSAFLISAAGIVLPFALGVGVAMLLQPHLEPHPDSGRPPAPFNLALFMGTAMSITALPILGRMMMEFNVTRSRVGTITISAAAMDDAAGWTLLAAVTAIAAGNYGVGSTVAMLGYIFAFTVAMVLLVRPLLVRLIRLSLKRGGGELSVDALAALLCVIFVCAIMTSLIGIFAIFGAFILGAVLSGEEEFRNAVKRRLQDLVTAFFLPIFFTHTGLKTDIGSLGTVSMWLFCGLVLLAAVVGKFGGCSIAARFSGFSARESLIVGVMMNTRALMELIVINVGYQLQIIPPSVFCMLVIMALVTTVMTTPIFVRLAKGTSLEPLLAESPFMRGKSQ